MKNQSLFCDSFLNGIAAVLELMPRDDAKYFIDKLEMDGRISNEDAQKLRDNRGVVCHDRRTEDDTLAAFLMREHGMTEEELERRANNVKYYDMLAGQ